MFEEILPDLYRIEVPLPGSPLKALNSYLIRSQGRNLVVDTGMNRDECRLEMLASLEALEVDLEETDFFITHLHADHVGMAGYLPTARSRVHMGAFDAHILNDELGDSRWAHLCDRLQAHGLPVEEARKAVESLPGRIYGPRGRIDVSPLVDGDELSIGGYSFFCVQTPGHTPGHICLYEPARRLLICGDHILDTITPNITFWPEVQDSLADYFASLDKVCRLDVGLVLPGHRNVITDHRKRIEELREHHQLRLKEILASLDGEERTAFEIAPHISWDIDYASWEDFPPLQKWFAMGETIAHLTYVELRGLLRRRTEAGRVSFSLARPANLGEDLLLQR